jgi:GNAT superfamily N-acetyltransferase
MPTSAIEITISPATAGDAEAVRELRLEALRGHPEAFSADYEVDFNKSLTDWRNQLGRHNGADSILYLAYSGSLLVGMTGIARGWSTKTIHTSTIWGVYVRPNFRRHGVARQLLEACVGWAAKQAVKVVKLAVVSTNTAAIQCYANCGFRVYGIEPKALFYDKFYYDELLMVREIE